MCPKQVSDQDPKKVRRHLPKLVGRDKELQLTKKTFNKAIKGQGSMVLIEGETGTGKTRLLSEMDKRAREAGLRVLWARCIGGAQPLLPFLNALENVSGKVTAMEASIEEVFYLHSDGRLILHETQRQKADVTDEDLRGLLKEIKNTSKAGLRGLFLGERRIMVEVGAVTVLAAVVRGDETPKMRQQMRYLLATIEDKFGEILMNWKGRVADLKGLRDSMKSLLLGDYGKPEVLKFDFELTSPTVSEDIAKFLVASSREIPMAIFFDDVHWMDPASLELMEILCHRNSESRLVIIGTFRPEEVDRQEEGEGAKGLTLRTVMERLEKVDRFIVLKLGPLTKDDIGEMLASVYIEGGIKQDFIDFVFRHGDGNPFYTEEILRSLEDSGKLWLSPDGWVTENLTAMDIPVTIREAVHVRMADLSKREREVLQHAAAIGREWELDVLVRVLKDPSGIEDILERLEKTKLVIKKEDGNYRFEHDIVRETAYEEMSEALRKLYHKKIGEAFEALRHAREGPDESVIPADDLLFKLAGHFSRSKDMEKALKYNVLAGRTSRDKHDLKGAEIHFSRSLTAARALRNRDSMIDVLFELTDIQEMNGEWDQALSNYNELLSMLTASEKKNRVRTLVKVSIIYEWRDEWNSAMENLEEALEISERIGYHIGRAMALAEKGRVLRRLGNYDQSFSLLTETLEILDDLCKTAEQDKEDERLYIDTRMRTLKERASVQYYRGAYEKAEADYQTSLKMARDLEDEALVSSLLMNLGITYIHMDQIAKGIEHYERSIDLATKVGNLRTLAYAYANLAEVLSTEKRFDEAASYIRKALEVHRHRDRIPRGHGRHQHRQGRR